jgi:hypothetical protein
MQRHGWSEDILDLIDFDVIGRIRKQLKWTDKTRTMKVLHGWLAVMHNMGKRNGITQCPGCPCEDETYLHLFSCKHSLMVKAISESLHNLHEGGRGAGQLPRAFIDRFVSCIEAGIREEPAPVPDGPPKLRLAVMHQNAIGTSKMLQGYLAISWAEALSEFGCKRVNTKMSWLLRQLWETVFLWQWDTRNYILHHMPNVYRRTETESFAERLRWFRDNRHLVLAPSDSHYAEHDEEAIERMGRRTRRKWVRQLDKLKTVYAQERTQRERGQATLTSFIKQKPIEAEDQRQATVARSQPRRNVKQIRRMKYKQQKLDWIQQREVKKSVNKTRDKENRSRTPPNGERIINRIQKSGERNIGKTQRKLAYLRNQENKSAQITPSPIRKLPIIRGPPEPD